MITDNPENLFSNYNDLMNLSSEKQRSWVDGLEDKWNAYIVFRTDNLEQIASVYRFDLCFEFVKLLNEKMDIPAWWSPDLDAGMRGGNA